jgi:hypothetical protein
MPNEIYHRIIALVLQAARLARTVGIHNLLQPGLVKEMIMADHLGHQLIITKRDADACDPSDNSILYEYLSCKEGGTGQLDRMFKEPEQERQRSLGRIMRNQKIFFAVFYADEQTRAKVIYEIEPRVLLAETERQLDGSRNAISHVGFTERWARANGKIVYADASQAND